MTLPTIFLASLVFLSWLSCLFSILTTEEPKLLHPIYCIGDGHAGIWNLFQEIGLTEQRQEILDWYHLKENLYQAGGSLRRLKQAESLLWCGQVNEVIDLFKHLKKKAFKTFCNYLETHRCRIINYLYYQEESLSSRLFWNS